MRQASAVKLVDDLAGESPVSADYPVGAVVISGDARQATEEPGKGRGETLEKLSTTAPDGKVGVV